MSTIINKEAHRQATLAGIARRKEREAKMTPAQLKQLKEKHRQTGLKAAETRKKNKMGIVVQKQLTTGQKAAATRKANLEKLSPAQRAARTRKFRAAYRQTIAMKKGLVAKAPKKTISVETHHSTVHAAVSLIESKVRKSVIQDLISVLQEMEKNS